jgi:hypothetical protein
MPPCETEDVQEIELGIRFEMHLVCLEFFLQVPPDSTTSDNEYKHTVKTQGTN